MLGKLINIGIIILVYCLTSCASKIEPQPKLTVNTPPVQKLTFSLQPNTLEANIMRLLAQHSDHKIVYWNVSKRHRVIARAEVSADNLFKLIDKVIAPYKKPSQLRATFYRANGVVTFDYDQSIKGGEGELLL